MNKKFIERTNRRREGGYRTFFGSTQVGFTLARAHLFIPSLLIGWK